MGLELPCLHTTQTIEHIECLIRHGGTQTITGQLLDGTIKQAKVELGISGPLLTQPYDIYVHLLTECWIKGVWKEVDDNDIQVTEKTASLQSKRDNDMFLTKQFTCKRYTNSQLALLNQCRLYLQIANLSDVTLGNGHYLLPNVFLRYNPLQKYNTIQWPRQGYPSKKAWLLWQQTIRRSFTTTTRRLQEPLGKWIHFDKAWGSFFDSSTSSLFVKGDRWMKFIPNTQVFTGHNDQYTFDKYSELGHNYSHVAIAWIDHNGNLQAHGISRKRPTIEQTQQHWTQEWVESVPQSTIQVIARAISSNKAFTLTDGSYKVRGSAGFCITDFKGHS